MSEQFNRDRAGYVCKVESLIGEAITLLGDIKSHGEQLRELNGVFEVLLSARAQICLAITDEVRRRVA